MRFTAIRCCCSTLRIHFEDLQMSQIIMFTCDQPSHCMSMALAGTQGCWRRQRRRWRQEQPLPAPGSRTCSKFALECTGNLQTGTGKGIWLTNTLVAEPESSTWQRQWVAKITFRLWSPGLLHVLQNLPSGNNTLWAGPYLSVHLMFRQQRDPRVAIAAQQLLGIASVQEWPKIQC